MSRSIYGMPLYDIVWAHLKLYPKLERPAPISQPLLFAHFAAINIAEEHGLCGQILRCSGGTLNLDSTWIISP